MTSEAQREKMRQTDHDLLIKLDVKMTDIGTDIKDLKDGLSTRVGNLEKRVDILEDFRSKAMGIGAVLTVFIGGFASWVWSRLTAK